MLNYFSDKVTIIIVIFTKVSELDNHQKNINKLNISISYIKWYVYCWCVYIPTFGLKLVNLGIASDFFHVLNYVTYGDESMKHHVHLEL